jgi:hypothetical protein
VISWSFSLLCHSSMLNVLQVCSRLHFAMFQQALNYLYLCVIIVVPSIQLYLHSVNTPDHCQIFFVEENKHVRFFTGQNFYSIHFKGKYVDCGIWPQWKVHWTKFVTKLVSSINICTSRLRAWQV